MIKLKFRTKHACLSAAILLSLAFGTSISNAQVAVINSQKVLASMPQVAKADTLVMQQRAQYVQELNKQIETVNKAAAYADSLYKTKPKDAATAKAIAEAQALNEAAKTYEQEANKKLEDYRNVMFTPYIDRTNAAIKAVAQRLKYKQVMDLQAVSMAWYDEATDITEAVIKEVANK